MARTRLLQITHDLHVGGLPRVVDTLCRTLDRDRFDVSVLCLRDIGPLGEALRDDLGIPVHKLREQADRPDHLAFVKIARFLRRHRFDVVHTHNTEPFVEGSLGALLARVPTLVHTDHARPFPDRRRYMLAEFVAAQFAWRVVGVSEHTTQSLRNWERLPSRKLVTVPNGIEGARYDQPVDEAAERAALGIPATAPVLGFASRLVEQKGLIYLLRALPAVLQVHPDLTLLVAGEGDHEDDQLDELERTARELGVEGAVRFLGVRLDIPALLKVFDLHVLPSLWEGLPMIILEAMAAGCPTVATAVGGVPAALEDGVDGALVPPRDPAALSAAILGLLADPERRRRYADRARAKFLRRFTAEAMTRSYEALYLRQPLPERR
jgi:glycosyltransferase involved in cell wall biosynthesis